MNRRTIFEIIGQYTELKRVGKEWKGLCPFHSEKTPSFSVNEEKGVFYCFACAEGGDLITFIEKAEGVKFKDALAHLGVEDVPRRSQQDQALKDRAAEIVAWGQSVSERIGQKLRAIGFQQTSFNQFEDRELRDWKLRSLKRQWDLLTVLDDDLFDPECLTAFYESRDTIEGLLAL